MIKRFNGQQRTSDQTLRKKVQRLNVEAFPVGLMSHLERETFRRLQTETSDNLLPLLENPKFIPPPFLHQLFRVPRRSPHSLAASSV